MVQYVLSSQFIRPIKLNKYIRNVPEGNNMIEK